jgi:tyrosine-protein kinase Etk/Wzc
MTPSPQPSPRAPESSPQRLSSVPVSFSTSNEDEVDLGAFIAHLIDSWKLIAIVATFVFVGSIAYAMIARPEFSADALLQVEEKGNVLAGLKDISEMFSGTSAAETEIQILRSRSVLGKVADQLKLDITAQPQRFPFIGGAIARRWEKSHDGVSGAWFGLSKYGWGGEKIDVERLDVPEQWQDRPLVLTAGNAGRYDLDSPFGERIVSGRVGQLERGANNESFGVFIADLRANPGTRFVLTKHSRPAVLASLRDGFNVLEQGKDTGIIELTLKGNDPVLLVRTLNAIDDAYLVQNVEQKSAEAEKTLKFVEGQLPDIRAQLEKAEAALNVYQSKTGNVDLKLETKSILERDVDLEKGISELQLQKSELAQRFTAEHPAIIALNQKLAQLEAKKDAINNQLKSLPDAELKQVQLMRDVEVSNEMYVLLLNKAQELKIMRSGTVGNVRILDAAVVDASRPVWPKKGMIVFSGLLLGLAFGAGAASAKRALHRGVDDPEQLEQSLGLPVYATIPHSAKIERRVRANKRRDIHTIPLLSTVDPKDMALESLRSLRTSLQFALADARANVLLVAGLRPGVGKSFVAANLAQVVGAAGKRVLVVDGDMRRGVLHSYFGFERGPGLSEVASGGVPVEQAVRPTDVENVSVITTGTLPPNPSELLLGDRFRKAIEWCAKSFDLVFIDAPPILAVTDASIIGGSVGVSLLVLKAGVHPAREIALGISRFEKNGVRVHGAVLNDMSQGTGAYAYGRYGYNYHYEYR